MSTVVIIGGGYAGVRVARALDEAEVHADVVLVEPRDAFHHNVAALRGLVDPRWLPRTFLPYDGLLTRGAVHRARAVEVGPDTVVLDDGTRLTPDILVLATGSSYPFPAKAGETDHGAALARYETLHANLARAGRVLLLGAGAVGLELAGEIASAWPDKTITLVDPAPTLLPGPYDGALREELTRQLDELGVVRHLGAGLRQPPPTEPGDVKAFTVTTDAGDVIEADLWLRCYGIAPVSDYLTGSLAGARTAEGYLHVDEELRVVGHSTVYALGDLADIDANKAGVARRQAAVVAANITATLTGEVHRERYEAGPSALILPLGPTGGAGEVPGRGLLTADVVSQLKGNDMFVGQYEELFRVTSSG